MEIKLAHGTYQDCEVRFHKYPNNRPALCIYQDGQVLLKASVNMSNHNPPDGYIFIKNWAENEGILEILIENKVIALPQAFLSYGFVQIPLCKLLCEVPAE